MDPLSSPPHAPPLQPPVPFADFEFSFDPALSNLFPAPPPLPSSADLFSPSETTDLLGFLDNFNWEFDVPEPTPVEQHHGGKTLPPYSNPHLDTAPEPSTSSRSKPTTRSASSRATPHATSPILPSPSAAQSSTKPASPPADDKPAPGSRPSKPLLSTPQKRLNHIMSEQKRRNAIRDGYAQLIALLGAPGLGMPTRGRPKGSGSGGKGSTKGKSGVLFRAVEYTKWLEEGRDALREEVERVERAAGMGMGGHGHGHGYGQGHGR